MNILITGATSFIGKNLFKFLSKKKSIKFTLLNSDNCNLFNEENLNKFKHIKYDYIFHLAAWIQGGTFALENTAEVWIKNQKINSNLLSWISKFQKKSKIICIGSSGSYDPKFKLVEDNYLIGKPHISLYTYGMTKRMLFIGLKSLNDQYGIKYLYLVPSTIYGPNYHLGKRRRQFIYDLIHKILDGKIKNKKVILWGNGLQKRELVYIDDLIYIISNLYNKIDNEIINISPNSSSTIKSYAKIICKKLDYDHKKIIYDKDGFVGTKNRSIDNNKLLKTIKNIKFTEYKDGIEKTIHWYKKNIYLKS